MLGGLRNGGNLIGDEIFSVSQITYLISTIHISTSFSPQTFKFLPVPRGIYFIPSSLLHQRLVETNSYGLQISKHCFRTSHILMFLYVTWFVCFFKMLELYLGQVEETLLCPFSPTFFGNPLLLQRTFTWSFLIWILSFKDRQKVQGY